MGMATEVAIGAGVGGGEVGSWIWGVRFGVGAAVEVGAGFGIRLRAGIEIIGEQDDRTGASLPRCTPSSVGARLLAGLSGSSSEHAGSGLRGFKQGCCFLGRAHQCGVVQSVGRAGRSCMRGRFGGRRPLVSALLRCLTSRFQKELV